MIRSLVFAHVNARVPYSFLNLKLEDARGRSVSQIEYFYMQKIRRLRLSGFGSKATNLKCEAQLLVG